MGNPMKKLLILSILLVPIAAYAAYNTNLTAQTATLLGTGNSNFTGYVGFDNASPATWIDVGATGGDVGEFGEGGTSATNTYIRINNRLWLGWDGTNGNGIVQGGQGHGLEFAVNGGSSSFAAGIVETINSVGTHINNPTLTASSGTDDGLDLFPTVTNTSTATYNALKISPYESTIGGTGNYLLNVGTSTAANGGGTYTPAFQVQSPSNGLTGATLVYNNLYAGKRVTVGSTGTTGTGMISAISGLTTGAAPAATSGISGLSIPAQTFTTTAASSSVTSAGMNSFGIPTLTASNAWTITNLSTLYIDGPPVAGSGVTASNTYALHVNAGNSNFGGAIYDSTKIQSPGIISGGGTKFTASGCSNSTTVGGSTAGSFASGTTGTCTVVVTMNGATGLAAPNGWACAANDLTTTADTIKQTASSTTTATLSGTTVSGDVINFTCTGY